MSPPTSPYIFSRSYTDSARLIVQHWLWQHRLRYLLHPSITLPSSSQPFRIADIGTGNAIYLLDLSASLPSTNNIHLDGFDISPANFPAKDWLPSNVTLHTLDAFGDLPQELVGAYDVVHIRAFAIVVRGNDPGVLLRNVIRMLKPSGYLQWDEMDLSTFHASPPSLTCSTALLSKWKTECHRSGIFWDWIHTLPSHFRAHGLERVEMTVFEPVHSQRKAFTDNMLMGLEDTCRGFEARGVGGREQREDLGGRKKGTEEEGEEGEGWWTLFASMVQEMKPGGGGSLTADLLVVVGRKPGTADEGKPRKELAKL